MRFIKFKDAIINLDFVKFILCEDKTVRMYFDGGNLSVNCESDERAKMLLDGIYEDIEEVERKR